MKKLFPLLFLLSFALPGCFETHCDEDQQNPVLRDNPKTSEAYQRELARMALEKQDETHFYFEEYQNRDGQVFMVVNTIGTDFCGELHLLLDETQAEDVSYRDELGFKAGEVENLQFSLPDEGYPRLVTFEDIKVISD